MLKLHRDDQVLLSSLILNFARSETQAAGTSQAQTTLIKTGPSMTSLDTTLVMEPTSTKMFTTVDQTVTSAMTSIATTEKSNQYTQSYQGF